jgi:hypothetical protein
MPSKRYSVVETTWENRNTGAVKREQETAWENLNTGSVKRERRMQEDLADEVEDIRERESWIQFGTSPTQARGDRKDEREKLLTLEFMR